MIVSYLNNYEKALLLNNETKISSEYIGRIDDIIIFRSEKGYKSIYSMFDDFHIPEQANRGYLLNHDLNNPLKRLEGKFGKVYNNRYIHYSMSAVESNRGSLILNYKGTPIAIHSNENMKCDCSGNNRCQQGVLIKNIVEMFD